MLYPTPLYKNYYVTLLYKQIIFPFRWLPWAWWVDANFLISGSMVLVKVKRRSPFLQIFNRFLCFVKKTEPATQRPLQTYSLPRAIEMPRQPWPALLTSRTIGLEVQNTKIFFFFFLIGLVSRSYHPHITSITSNPRLLLSIYRFFCPDQTPNNSGVFKGARVSNCNGWQISRGTKSSGLNVKYVVLFKFTFINLC